MKPVLLVIDMLNDFIKGKLKISEADNITPNIRRLIEVFHEKELPVIYVCDSHIKGVDYELKIWGEHAIKGTWGAKVIDELAPKEVDYVVYKRRYSGFFETDLDLLLRELKVDTLVLVGVSTNVCVQHTAADAFFRNYKIIVISDATAAFTKEAHEQALQYMKEIYKAEVLSTEEFIEKLGEQFESARGL